MSPCFPWYFNVFFFGYIYIYRESFCEIFLTQTAKQHGQEHGQEEMLHDGLRVYNSLAVCCEEMKRLYFYSSPLSGLSQPIEGSFVFGKVDHFLHFYIMKFNSHPGKRPKSTMHLNHIHLGYNGIFFMTLPCDPSYQISSSYLEDLITHDQKGHPGNNQLQ